MTATTDESNEKEKVPRMRPHFLIFPSAEPRTARQACRKVVFLLFSVTTVPVQGLAGSMSTGKKMCVFSSR